MFHASVRVEKKHTFVAQLFSRGAEHSGASAKRETKQVLAELIGNYDKLP